MTNFKHFSATAQQSMRQLWSFSEPQKYATRDTKGVVAVRLDLETGGFEFDKWGGTQRCKRNDWLVHNLLDNDTYVVDDEVFKETYQESCGNPGHFKKTGTVYAVKADRASRVNTIEGETHYNEGDYIVSHRKSGGGLYAMGPSKFEKKYIDFDEHVANEEKNVDKWLQKAGQEKEKARKSLERNRILHWGLQVTSIVAGALVPVLSVLEDWLADCDFSTVQLAIAVFGFIAMVSSSVQTFWRFSERYSRDRITLRELKNLTRDAEGATGCPLRAEEIEAQLKKIRKAREGFLDRRGGDQGAAD